MREIPGFDGYFCDQGGGVWSNKRGEIRPMRLKTSKLGYQIVALYLGRPAVYKHALVHRLILSTWLGESDLHANHKNGNRADNRLSNLEWVTRSQNEQHAINVLGKNMRGTAHPLAKMTDSIVAEIRSLRQQGRTYQSLADQFGIGLSHAARVANGKVWRHVP